MKNKETGFMLIETLLVTIFVSGALIFIYFQFTKLNKLYDDSYKYNTVEALYSLEDVKNYILSDSQTIQYIDSNVGNLKYIDITDCKIFTNKEYCLTLFNMENIKHIFITTNTVSSSNMMKYNDEFINFINKINSVGSESYRIVAEFYNSTYATIRLY